MILGRVSIFLRRLFSRTRRARRAFEVIWTILTRRKHSRWVHDRPFVRLFRGALSLGRRLAMATTVAYILALLLLLFFSSSPPPPPPPPRRQSRRQSVCFKRRSRCRSTSSMHFPSFTTFIIIFPFHTAERFETGVVVQALGDIAERFFISFSSKSSSSSSSSMMMLLLLESFDEYYYYLLPASRVVCWWWW